jgi:sigma-B regulation protein RsbU (phosphoserine phosphatase)
MSEQYPLKAAGEPGDSLSKQLEFLGNLGDRLVAAEDPEEFLEAPLPALPGAAAAPFARAAEAMAALARQNASLKAQLAEQLGVRDSLAMAADLQASLQPNSPAGHQPIWGVNLPARQVSGDFFDFYRLDEGRLAFALGDVSGKGMNAALLMAKTISLFRCLGKRIERPGELLEAINAELYETASRGMFVTMVAGHYRIASGEVCLANAGHQPPLLRSRDRSYESFPAAAPPLGLLAVNRPPEEHLRLDGGELYVFSDGLTEYHYVSGERLGVEGLIQLIEALAEAPLASRLEALLQTLDQESGWEARDDLTVLAIDDAWVAPEAAEPAADPTREVS